MPIAAITSNPVPVTHGRAMHASADPAIDPASTLPEDRPVGRRQDLVAALHQVLGAESVQASSDDKAVSDFTHALAGDLQRIDSRSSDQDPGQTWGRRAWNALPQRLDALAAATSARATAAVAAGPVSNADAAHSGSSEQVVLPEIPPQPKPLTANSAALHLMEVPSSHLLEAYAALRQALGEQARAPAAATPHADLAALLTRLAQELASAAPTTLPTGSALNLTA